MEHRAENLLDKLLTGHAEGAAVALRGCPDDLYQQLAGRFDGRFLGRLRILEPCRVEHPHSAYLRKSLEAQGRRVVQTTLYAPDGRLTEERTDDGEALERFVKKPSDFETLRGHLRDMELHPAKAQPRMEGVTDIAALGLTPVREMETRWAGPDMTAWAWSSQNESAASCLRKLERQFHRRCEEACRAGCRAGYLRDMCAEPLPETYMLYAGRHIEWMRHAGLAPWVEASRPEPMLLAALNAAHAGARVALNNELLYEETFVPPEGMRFMFDLKARGGLDGLWTEMVRDLIKKCACAVLLVDCGDAGAEDIAGILEYCYDIVK